MLYKPTIEKFLNALLKALNKASLYQPTHHLFLETVEEFKQEVVPILEEADTIIIVVSTKSLTIDGEEFSDSRFQGLATKLHLRRVKNIEITKGVTSEELCLFFSRILSPIKEIYKAGGLPNLLSKEIMTHLLIHNLDYSELLTDEMGEYKDIWPFLLGECVAKADDSTVIKLTTDFAKMISYYTLDEILEDADMLANIRNFLGYLKNRDKDKFLQCSRGIAQHIFAISNAA